MQASSPARARIAWIIASSLGLAAGCNALFAVDELTFDEDSGGSGGNGGSVATPGCDDGRQGDDETDVDCGGRCAPCTLGLGCKQASDCTTSLCLGGLCSACSDASDCEGGWFCDPATGTCLDGKPNGFSCEQGAECYSGFCPPQDGVCCDSACSLTCEACLAIKTGAADGICDFVNPEIAPDPDGECPAEVAFSCGNTGQGCSGFRTACALYDANTVCGVAICESGVATSTVLCDGDGSCPEPATQSCGVYVCDVDNCKTSCAAQGDCIANYYCSTASTCLYKKSTGQACSANYECMSGSCASGFCA